MTDYEKISQDFMEKQDVTIIKEFIGLKRYFQDDSEPRNVWKITVTRRGENSIGFDFGDSLANSNIPIKSVESGNGIRVSGPAGVKICFTHDDKAARESYRVYCRKQGMITPPSDYDILACIASDAYLESDDEYQFCLDYRYDVPKSWDEYKALRDTYEKSKRQATQIKRLFSDCLDELWEIA